MVFAHIGTLLLTYFTRDLPYKMAHSLYVVFGMFVILIRVPVLLNFRKERCMCSATEVAGGDRGHHTQEVLATPSGCFNVLALKKNTALPVQCQDRFPASAVLLGIITV